MNARHAGLLLVAVTLFVGGCSDRKLRPLNPCTVTGVVRKVSAGGSENVDLLFMIDNSGSMESEQEALESQIPDLARVLLTGDLALDGGEPDFPPVASLRFGVISSDMGVLGIGAIDPALPPPDMDPTPLAGISRCGQELNGGPFTEDRAFFGDDGQIQLVSTAFAQDRVAGCEPVYPDFLQFDQVDGGDDAAINAFADDVACTALLGTGGCGFEMQLESVLVAVTDSQAHPEIVFAPTTADGASRNRTGRETPGGTNDGFFRDGSVIAIVLVTDEEDCSTANPEVFMFHPEHSSLQDPEHQSVEENDFRVNTRCTHFANELYSIGRYVEGLQALRPDDPNKIVFAGIVGLPTDLETSTFDEMLADPRMEYTDRIDIDGDILDNGVDPFIVPACWRCETAAADFTDCVDPVPGGSNEDLQWAAPGRRFVELADQITDVGMNAVIRSICTDDFGPAMQTILERIGDVLKGACLPRALNPDATGRVNCDVVEILPVGGTCAERAQVGGRDATPIRTEASPSGTREVCRVTQLVPTPAEEAANQEPPGVGWFYDDYIEDNLVDCTTTPAQRIGFTGADPVGDVRLECLQPVQGGGLEGPDMFRPCSEGCNFEGDQAVTQLDEFVFRYNLDRTRFIDGNGALTGTQPMSCENATNTCQIRCGDASDCPGGFVCADPANETSAVNCGATECFCVNPTCVVGGAGGPGPTAPDAG